MEVNVNMFMKFFIDFAVKIMYTYETKHYSGVTIMSKSKKSVKHKKNHPLSKQDKFLYGFIETIGAIILLSSVDIYKILAHLIIFKKSDVLAFEERWSVFLLVPVIFFWLFLLLNAISKKIPIIGNKKVDYFNTTNFKSVFPLFDERYKNNEKYLKGRKEFLKKSIAYFGVFICLLSIGCMGCIGRHEFNEKGIVTYSILNNKTTEYSYDDVEKFCVSAITKHERRTRGVYYHTYDMNLIIYMKNGDSFTASYNRARDVYALEKINNQLKDKKKTVDSYYLQDFIDSHEFTSDELRVIDKIFEE